jgi:HEPN domain-containing protein
MAEPSREAAAEWFERGDRDLDTAQLLYDEHGYSDVIAYHVQQAVEKYLKGYLVFKGQRPPRIHELDTLLNLVSKTDPDLYSPYIDLCEKATRYYIEERYPPGPSADYTREEMQADLYMARQLVRAIKGKIQV